MPVGRSSNPRSIGCCAIPARGAGPRAAGPSRGPSSPTRPLRSTVGRVFAVGDAAGQCLPLTAEGIRPALYFGGEGGRIVQRVLDGAGSLEAGLEAYQRLRPRD